MSTPFISRAVRGRLLLAALIVLAVVVSTGIAPSLAGAYSTAGHGLLTVTTSPQVPATILVNGVARNSGSIQGLELPAGDHELAFGAWDGYLTPAEQTVTVGEGQVTAVSVDFVPAGTLQIDVTPAELAPIVSVGGIPRDRGSVSLSVAASSLEVCAEDVVGYATPPCEIMTVAQGDTNVVTMAYVPLSDEGSDEDANQQPPLTRVGDDLVALYDFRDGAGERVADRHGSTDLRIADASRVTWVDDGLRFDEPTVARAGGLDIASISSTGAFTLETWVTPANLSQRGPARIIGLSTASIEYAMVGQGNHTGDADLVEARIDGLRMMTPRGSLAAESTHIVFTRDSQGATSLYLDGERLAQSSDQNDLATWSEKSMELILGDQYAGGRAWLGTYHLVAVYDAALGADQVAKNFAVGPSGQEVLPGGSGGDDLAPEPEPVPDSEPEAGAPGGEDPSSWSEAWGSDDEGTIRSWYRQNTGIAAGGLEDSDLTVHNGTLDTQRDGQIIAGMLVNGQINVRHDNVTIRNTKVVNNGDTIAVNISFERGSNGDVDTLTMENVSLIGTGGASEYRQAIGATFAGLHHDRPTPNVGLRASRVYISGFGGGFRLSHFGDDRVELSMVENILTHPGSHNTGMSFRGGHGKTVTRNWIEGSTSSALSLYPDVSPVLDFLSEDNLFDGGTYSIHAGENKSHSSGNRDLRFIGNKFTRDHQYGPLAAYDPSKPGWEWSGNRYLDGQPININ